MRKIRLRDKQKNILLSILAVIIACIFLFPLYWIIVNSFKIDSEIFSSVPTLWPKKFTITAYKDLIGNLSVTLKNSVIIALGSMILSLVLSEPAAYGLARYKVKGMKLFVLVFLVTQMLPASLVLTPLFLIFSKLGLLNSYLAPREVQPSILAASSSSLGILRKPGLNIKTTNGIEIVAVLYS